MMNKQTRSDSYVCTLSTYDEQKIAAVREMVRQSNLLNRLANKRDRWGNPLRHKLKVRARLGRNSPYHMSTLAPFRPCSISVGTSASRLERRALVMAIGNTRRSRIAGSAGTTRER